MIDFPASPTVGQQFTAAGVTWTWDGTKWTAGGLGPIVGGINDNRIINGDMRIDQRNNGASGTAVGYTVDRWTLVATQTNKFAWGRNMASQATSPGFPYYLAVQTSAAYASLASDYFHVAQRIESDMVSDFAWGMANAKPVTLSFWAFANIAGTYSGSINNGGTRSYPFTFVLAANTPTFFTIPIPADTGGTWNMSGNSTGVQLSFDLGSGTTYRGPANAWASTNYLGVTGAASLVATLSAFLYITGVKLEIGSVVTPFNRYSLAKSMADCQRYYQTVNNIMFGGNVTSGANYYMFCSLPFWMRAAPTLTLGDAGNNGFAAGLPSTQGISNNGFQAFKTANATVSGGYFILNCLASAEL
jgi:hypothetical protein